MDLRMLGPLEIADGAGGIDLAGDRQQVVLALLLLETPRVVSIQRIIDALWDDPPSSARGQVHICVSLLRTKLVGEGAPRIVTRKPGYVLTLGSATRDLDTFRALVVRARGEAEARRNVVAAELLHEALEIWRGPALHGIDARFVRDSAVELEDGRVAALELYADLELELGRHAELVSRLRLELSRDPLQERLRARLMLALYRAGRRSDALAQFHQAREIAVEQLGIEPAAELSDLMNRMLRGDPQLDPLDRPGAQEPSAATPHAEPEPEPEPEARGPRLLPSDISDFTGRRAVIDAIQAHLVDDITANDEAAPIVVISGTAGAGKSTMALHLAHQASTSYPGGQYYLSLHGTTQPLTSAQALERLLRAVGTPGTAIPADLDERAETLRSRTAGKRILFLLDDAADETQVLPLLPPPGCAVLITSRRRLTALPGAVRTELSAFSTASAVELLTKIIGPGRAVGGERELAELVELCDRLPLAVRIVGARLAARPHWPLGEMLDRLSTETGQLDELRHGTMAVRASIALSYDALTEPAQRLFRLLALVDNMGVGAWAFGPLLGARRRDALDAIDELVETHLVTVSDAHHDPRFAQYHLHDLVRVFGRERAIAEETSVSRDEAVQRYLGALMALLDEAHRREYGGDFLVLHGVGPRYPLDERTRDELLADPLVWLADQRHTIVASVSQAAAVAPNLTWDLAMTSVVLFEAHSLFDDWRRTHRVALETCRRTDDVLGEAAMLYSLGSLAMFEMQLESARELLGEAYDMFTDLHVDHGRAVTLRNQASIDALRGDYDTGERRAHEALPLLRAAGDRIGEAYVLRRLAEIDNVRGRRGDALARLRIALETCEAVGNRRVAAQITQQIGNLHLETGDHESAGECFDRVLGITRGTGDRIGEMHGLIGRASVQLKRGDDCAVASLLTAERIASAYNDERMRGRSLRLLGRAALDAGDGDTACAHTRSALEISQRLGIRDDADRCLNQLREAEELRAWA